MVVLKPRRSAARRRIPAAVALAVSAHLLALLALGWRIPVAPSAAPSETLPPVEITLLRPPPAHAAPASPASGRARPSPTRPEQPQSPAPPAVVAAPQAPALAEGPADCAPEDLPLLTDTEKARCRNQIDADKARRLARGADDRAARQVAEAQRGPRGYRMSGEKQAYYDAVADAYWQQTHGPPMAGRHPQVLCSGAKPVNSLKIGPLPCYVTPPQGFLTEESGIPPP